MANKNAQEDLIINKCLIIDDKLAEVQDIILKLNEYSISTDFRKDVLDGDVIVDSNTQLVILDLYMSDKTSIDDALSSVAFLNENIKGPYFLLVWTKHRDKFDKFTKELSEKYSDDNNFPLDIKMLSAIKTQASQSTGDIEKVVNEIIKNIKVIKGNHNNVYNYLKLTQIFQNQSTTIWQCFSSSIDKKNKKDNEDIIQYYTRYYEETLGKAFYFFDKLFNYEKSGKGFLNVHSRFLENELTINNIHYTHEDKENELDEKIKNEINSKLIVHDFKNPKPEDGLPGLIYKEEKLNGDFSDFGDLKNIFNKSQLGNSKILLPKLKIGKLVITPYCDFAHNKKSSVLYLPILIVEDDFKNRNKLFKNNAKFQNMYNGKYLVYNSSMYNVCSINDLGPQTYSFYLAKEYVNNIQINVANNISRIGTTIID